MLRHLPPLITFLRHFTLTNSAQFYGIYGVQPNPSQPEKTGRPLKFHPQIPHPNLKKFNTKPLKPTPRAKNRLLLPTGSTKPLKPSNSKKKNPKRQNRGSLYN